MNPDLAQRVEECFFHAWPALRTVVVDGWHLRFANGLSRRANSVNPVAAGQDERGAKIAFCETHYRAQNLPTLFRLADFAEQNLDGELAQRGYTKEGESQTLYRDLRGLKVPRADGVETMPNPNLHWFAGLARAGDQAGRQRDTYRRIVGRIRVPAVFAATQHDGVIGSVAYGAFHAGLLAIESVATDPDLRRLGLARRNLNAILAWGHQEGAVAAILQVESTNLPALALYSGLGFRTALYRYHYRRKPAA
jgi:ribosomal protein S18 acetylase RimI-like enzyme